MPFAGFVGDYQSAIQVLSPTVNGFPWLSQVVGGFFENRPDGATYTMDGDDIPFFLVHLDHQSRRMKFEVWDDRGRFKGVFSEDQFLPRNSGANSFFAFEWDGEVVRGGASSPLPNGTYIVRISVLKALGDVWDPAHTEYWVAPLVTIARP